MPKHLSVTGISGHNSIPPSIVCSKPQHIYQIIDMKKQSTHFQQKLLERRLERCQLQNMLK